MDCIRLKGKGRSYPWKNHPPTNLPDNPEGLSGHSHHGEVYISYWRVPWVLSVTKTATGFDLTTKVYDRSRVMLISHIPGLVYPVTADSHPLFYRELTTNWPKFINRGIEECLSQMDTCRIRMLARREKFTQAMTDLEQHYNTDIGQLNNTLIALQERKEFWRAQLEGGLPNG